MADVPQMKPEVAAAAVALLGAFGDPKAIAPEIERWSNAIEDAKATEAAANERVIQASQRIEQATAAERSAKSAQEALNRDRAAFTAAQNAYNAKISHDTSEITTTRVALEQREQAVKAEEARLASVKADLDEQARQLGEKAAAVEALGNRYRTAVSEMAQIVARAG